jgi:hypothetical protein
MQKGQAEILDLRMVTKEGQKDIRWRVLQMAKVFNGFVIKKDPEVKLPTGVYGQLIWLLWKHAAMRGIFTARHLRFVYAPILVELGFKIAGRGCGNYIIVRSTSGGFKDEELYFDFRLQNGYRVKWEKGLLVREVSAAVACLNRDFTNWVAQAKVNKAVVEGKISQLQVAEIFSLENVFFIIKPGMPLDLVLASFDKPDLLTTLYFGAHTIIVKKDEVKFFLDNYYLNIEAGSQERAKPLKLADLFPSKQMN